MRAYLLKRVLLMVPTFLGITVLTFAIAHLAPGDPLLVDSELTLGPAATAETVAAYRKAHGLDQPIPVQYVRWLVRVCRLDFGRSLQDHRPVMAKVAEALPRTLFLSLASLVLAYVAAVPLGVLAAVKRRGLLDRAITMAVFVVYSLPSFWVAVMLLAVFSSGRVLDWFPVQGLTSDDFHARGPLGKVADLAWHATLPVVCLTYGSLATISRYARAGMLEVLGQDFIRTARAKGLTERVVLWRHGLRNALLPLVTLVGSMLPYVLGGSVIVERIFGIPGMGLLAFDAIAHRDYPMVMGLTTLTALLTMVSLLAVDLLYGVVDPRMRAKAAA